MFDIKNKLSILRKILFKYENKITKKIRRDIIDVRFCDNLIIIDILDNCEFFDYLINIQDKYKLLKNVFVPTKVFFTSKADINDYLMIKQTIYIFNNNEYQYFITVSDDKIKILEIRFVDNMCYEKELDYKVNEKEYVLFKLINDSNNSYYPKWYPASNPNNALSEEEFYELVTNLFDNLKDFKNIKNIIDIDEIINLIIGNFSLKKKL